MLLEQEGLDFITGAHYTLFTAVRRKLMEKRNLLESDSLQVRGPEKREWRCHCISSHHTRLSLPPRGDMALRRGWEEARAPSEGEGTGDGGSPPFPFLREGAEASAA